MNSGRDDNLRYVLERRTRKDGAVVGWEMKRTIIVLKKQ